MKKLFFLVLLIFALALPAMCLAASTVVETIDYHQRIQDQEVVVLKYVITADAAAGTVSDITVASWTVDDLSPSKQVNLLNFYVYGLETVPGSGGDQPNAYTVDLKNAVGRSVLDIAARSQTAVEWVKGSETDGVFPPVTADMTLAIGDLGNSNKTTVYIYYAR